MNASYDKIETVLDLKLRQIAQLPEIFPENAIPKKPKVNEAHIWTQFVPVTRTPSAAGPDPLFYYSGFYTINVCVPKFEGTTDLRRLVGILIDEMGGPFSISHDNFYITIPEAQIESGFDREPHYCVPVVVDWYCYAP